MIYVGSLAGLLPGGPGHSHQSVRDISALGAVPQPDRSPSRASKPRSTRSSTTSSTPRRERLPAAGVGEVAGAVRVSRRHQASSWQAAGSSATAPTSWCSATGRGCSPTRIEAAEEVEAATGVSVRLVNLPWLNRVDPAWLRDVDRRRAARSSRSTTTTCTAARARCSRPRSPSSASSRRARVTRVGVTELPECGTNDEVLAYHRLDVDGRSRPRCRQAVPAARMIVALLGHRRHAADHRQGGRVRLGGGGPRGHRPRLRASSIRSRRADRLSDRGQDVRDARTSTPTRRPLRRMVRRYEELLPGRAAAAAGPRAAERARDPRAPAQPRPDVRSYLLTGNTRGGARAKLTHYDLFEYLPGRRVSPRTPASAPTIAARALELARRAGPVADDGVFVIGDTPHDIECAQRHRRADDCRGDRRLHGRRARSRTVRGACSSSCRPRRRVRAADRRGRRPQRAEAQDRGRHEARHPPFPRALAGLAAGAALVSRARATPIRTGARSSPPTRERVGSGAPGGRRAARAC